MWPEELALVDRLGIDEVGNPILLVSSSFHVIVKMIIPMSQNP